MSIFEKNFWIARRSQQRHDSSVKELDHSDTCLTNV